MRSKHVGPLHVRATRWQENDKITCYTTRSRRWNGTGWTVWEESFGARTFKMPRRRDRSPLRTVYKAKRASSVRSAFLWEPPGARAGWAGLAPGGDGRVSAAFARSSRNLSNSERSKLICHGNPERRGFIYVFESVQGWTTLHTCLSQWNKKRNCDRSIPSLVTPSSAASPFY